MKTVLHIWKDDQQQLHASTDYYFPEKLRRPEILEWEDGLYLQLAEYLIESNRDVRKAITLLYNARTDARLHYQELHPDLEKALLQWRRDLANEKGIPAFIIMNQRTLLAIADAAPRTRSEMLDVPGVGVGIIDNYGDDILQIVKSTLPEP